MNPAKKSCKAQGAKNSGGNECEKRKFEKAGQRGSGGGADDNYGRDRFADTGSGSPRRFFGGAEDPE